MNINWKFMDKMILLVVRYHWYPIDYWLNANEKKMIYKKVWKYVGS